MTSEVEKSAGIIENEVEDLKAEKTHEKCLAFSAGRDTGVFIIGKVFSQSNELIPDKGQMPRQAF